MTNFCGCFGFILIVAVLSVVVNAQGGESPGSERNSPECSLPPEGDWMVVHNNPTVPGNDTLVAQLRTVLSLRKESIPGVYSGRASGIASNSASPLIPLDSSVGYSVIGIFIEDICALAGTAYHFETGVVDPVVLYYHGEGRMSGPAVNFVNGTVVFSTMSRDDLTYLGTLE